MLSTYADIAQIYKQSSMYVHISHILIALIGLLFIVLLADPREVHVSETIQKNGVDIAIAFDVSYSMEATDIPPKRIDVARNVLAEFISGITSDRVALVLFAGKPFASTPLTFDM
jgi:Ca-activated chloride channel homolog